VPIVVNGERVFGRETRDIVCLEERGLMRKELMRRISRGWKVRVIEQVAGSRTLSLQNAIKKKVLYTGEVHERMVST